VEFDPPPGICVFWGDNGQGKTNLLESIYLLATLKSFRGAKNRDLVMKGQEQGLIRGRLTSRGLPRDCELRIDSRGKKARLDGKNPRALTDYFEVIKAVSFVPSDLRLVDGPPDGRRNFLDRATFTMHPEYLNEVRSYRSALAQKNALLRDALRRRRAPDAALLETWEEGLIVAGARLIQRRTDFLNVFAPVFREVHEGVTGAAKGHAEFRYRGCIGPETLAEGFEGIAAGLRAKMEASASVEASRGFCTVGPHRDDWELHVGGEPLKRFGSQGQVRSAALALRLAQMVLAQRSSGTCPLFLLDDVSSELDSARNRHLMDLVQSLPTQVFITTTDRSNIRIDSGACTSWQIRAGSLEISAS